MRAVLVSAAVVALAGCALGPDYERPPIALPAGMAAIRSSTGFTNDEPAARWWEMFKDPTLDQLVEDARAHNPSLQEALARVDAARGVARRALGPLFPQISGNGQYAYQQTSQNTLAIQGNLAGAAAAAGIELPSSPFQFWAGLADMSWEIDLWGRVRREHEAASAEAAATDEERKAVEVTLVAEVVDAYFDLGEATSDIELLKESLEVRRQSLAVVRDRVTAGLEALTALRRAENEIATVQASLEESRHRYEVAQHRLALLLGKMPDARFAGRPPAEFEVPAQLGIGLPAQLLERRPDIRSAEARLKAANARIGEAIANFLPSVTILGRFGYASIGIENLANPKSQLWSIGPSIHIPIFEGGATYARMLESEALKDAATARYYGTVLRAFSEVADALSGVGANAAAESQQRDAVKAATSLVALATIDYKHGLTSYLEVLDAQRTLLASRERLLRSKRLVLGNVVLLEKALGGGWTDLTAPTQR